MILRPMLFNIFVNYLVYAIKERGLTKNAVDTRLHSLHKDLTLVEAKKN